MNDCLEIDCYEEVEERTNWNNVRKRNLKINLAKILIAQKKIEKKIFSKEDLVKTFAFKEYDFKYIVNELFSISDDAYKLKDDVCDFLQKVYSSNEKVQNCILDAETEFLQKYGVYRDKLEIGSLSCFSFDEFKKMYDHIRDLIPILHWGKLPVFDRYLLFNRNIDPEKYTIEFYNHIDCLDSLLYEIRNENDHYLSNESDKSLNRDMSFSVFSRRWGHNDVYTIKRTVDGWYCSNISICGECKKDGSDFLFMNLDQDNIFYPIEGVKFAMNKLWEDADDGKIDFFELEIRLQQVADWISSVEKSISCQPDWVSYY